MALKHWKMAILAVLLLRAVHCCSTGFFFSSFFLYFCNVSIFTSLGHFFKISFAISYPLSILKESVDWKNNIKICNLEHGIFIRSPIHSYFNVFYILNFLSGLSQIPKRLQNMPMSHICSPRERNHHLIYFFFLILIYLLCCMKFLFNLQRVRSSK